MKNEIVIYQIDKLAAHLEVRVENETVWLSLNQICQLFGRDKSFISRHLRNIYKEEELTIASTVAKNATVQIEAGREVKREIEFYNLDAILSVGYRVNSKQECNSELKIKNYDNAKRNHIISIKRTTRTN